MADNYKKVEDLLYNYKMYKVYIENCKLDIEYLKNNDGVNGLSYDETPTSPTYKITSLVEDTSLANIEKIQRLQMEIGRCYRDKKISRLENALEDISDRGRIVIELFYMEDKQWWEVAAEIGYSEQHCRKLRETAIDKLVIGIYGE